MVSTKLVMAASIAAFLMLPVGGLHAEDKVLAEVNGVKITESETASQVASRIPMESYHRNISGEKMKVLKAQALEDLIDKELFYQDAVKKNFRVPDESVEGAFKKVKGRFRAEREFEEALKKAGQDEQGLKEMLRRELMISAVLDSEVVEKSAVTDAEAAEYFGRNRERYNEPEKLKVREIFFAVSPNATADEKKAKKEKAEKVLSRIKAGEDFGLLAWNNSEDKYRYKSGEIGYVHKGILTPEAEDAVFKLKPRESTGLVETIYGYYIFYLEERVPPARLGFEQVKEKIVKELRDRKEKEARKAYINGLRQAAEIKRF